MTEKEPEKYSIDCKYRSMTNNKPWCSCPGKIQDLCTSLACPLEREHNKK